MKNHQETQRVTNEAAEELKIDINKKRLDNWYKDAALLLSADSSGTTWFTEYDWCIRAGKVAVCEDLKLLALSLMNGEQNYPLQRAKELLEEAATIPVV